MLSLYFIITNLLSDIDIKKVTEMTFGKLLTAYENGNIDPTALLLRVLAYIIYHNKDIM